VLRALQAAGTVTAEVATANVNASTGAYAFDLPIARPRLAAYSTRLPLSFAAAGNGGRYTLEAAADGYATLTQAIDVTLTAATWNPAMVPE